jgi:hypothetical protein
MKTKTAYRPKPEMPAENIPAVEAAIEPSPEAPAIAVDVRPETESEAERKHADEVTKADEAAEALKRQIDALRQSEQLLRQPPQLQRPLTREDKLGLWRQQGIAENEYNFLVANPELIDNPAATAYCAREAEAQGHQRGSDEFLHAAKQIFDKYQAELQAQAQTPTEPAMASNDFFKPPPPKPPRPQYVPVSAPVSREPPGSRRSDFEDDPRRVVLSAEERQIAKASGLTDFQYAKGKLELQRRKSAGEIQ